MHTFLQKADVVFAIGASLTRHNIVAAPIPAGKTIIHATNDERDLNKHYAADYPLLGDAKPVLRQFIEAVKDLGRQQEARSERRRRRDQKGQRRVDGGVDCQSSRPTKNRSTPYRVMWEFMNLFDRKRSSSPTTPAARATSSCRSTKRRRRAATSAGASRTLWEPGLGLIMGAKLAAPEKFCVNFMGDAAFGMTGLDFETAVRCNIPTLTIVLNNNFMAAETHSMEASHERYGTMNILGNYADLAHSLGGWSERVEDPNQIVPALQRAYKTTQDGKAALLEFITSREIAYSRMRD